MKISLTILLGFIISYSAYTQVDCSQFDITTGLAAYYPFNGSAEDESGNANHGTVNGATLTTDRFGIGISAYYFDGNDYIEIQHSSSLDISEAITISSWIKTVDIQGGIISKWDGGHYSDAVQSYYQFVYPNGQSGGSVNASDYWYDNTVWGNTSVNNDVWNHIVYTADNNTGKIRLYVNGILDAEFDIYGNIIRQTDTRVLIGVLDLINFDQPYTWYTGLIDDIRIYNRALSDCDVLALFNENLDHKIKICHKGHEIFVDLHAIQAHLNHGDNIGNCPSPKNTFSNEIENDGFSLSQNSPNPFTNSSMIAFYLPETGYAEIKVYDMLSREVATVLSSKLSSGSHSVRLDGSKLQAGIYFYKLMSNNQSLTKTMIITR